MTPRAIMQADMVLELRVFGAVNTTIPIIAEIDPATPIAHQRSIKIETTIGATHAVRSR
jgi:hypothetical protein